MQNQTTSKQKPVDNRVAALARFAGAITLLNIFGHFYLGFEQSYAHWLVAIVVAYSIDFFMEFITARIQHRKPAYEGGFKKVVIFLLPAHITAQAVAMLTYTNVHLPFVVFGVAVAMLSKVIFRVAVKGKSKHFLNPSNTGIAVMYLVFPAIGSAPPYQFTEATHGAWDWILLGIFVSLGSFLNTKFTKKMPLIFAWLGMFFLQAVIRTNIFGTSTIAALGPMTGVAFLLFTFYMISDPTTTPMKMKNQIFFGASVAALYGVLMAFHIVFGLFFALFSVCAIRGGYLWITNLKNQQATIPATAYTHHKQENSILPAMAPQLMVVNNEPELAEK